MKKAKYELLIEDTNVTPFVISRLPHIMAVRMKKYLENPSTCIIDFPNKNVDWYIDQDLWKQNAKEIVEDLDNNPEKFIKFNKKLRDSTDKLKNYSIKLFKKNLFTLSKEELLKIYEKGIELFEYCYEKGMIPTVTDLGDPVLTTKLKELLTQSTDNTTKIDEYFVKLTTPEELSDIQKEHEELLELALNNSINDNSKEITKHYEKYFWLTHGYEGPLYFKKDIWNKIKEHRKNTQKTKKELGELKNQTKNTKQQIKQTRKELKFDEKTILIFSIAREWLYLKGTRKEAFFACYATFDKLAEEIAKKLKREKLEIKYLTKAELKDAITKNSLPKDIKERIKNSLYLWEKGKDKVLIKEERKTFLEKNTIKAISDKDKTLKEIKGQVAFIGHAIGFVKIIKSPSDMDKMEDGDVLVSPATNPNLMPAIKKASALVTDVGGITCHAAIVSRELKKPCVIGTKIATKVLKDGDKVEVNANEGIVKILKN